mgnify:FL=1|jgi:hypothetical protein|tara:strand:- start:3051 stop:3431 length:381 start_codon:yes stop_codon:yes gene_type:complete
MNNVARMEIPNRMRSVNVRMSIDDMPIVATMDYLINDNGILPVAVWVKTKKSESTLDRELRSSGKAVSLLLQYGCSLKEISETFTRDSIIGSVVWYLFKNTEDILQGKQPDKLPKLSTQPSGYTIK